jgi:iron complex outermembrane receptor protein
MRAVALALLVFWSSAHGNAQPAPPDTTIALDAIEATATPFAVESARAPLALTVRTRSDADLATNPALGLDALARGVPGLWVADRENYALGERVLVRGLGWRAAFGVRGTHVLLDGVPLTLPDGQTMLNVVDAAAVRRIEVVRGPVSVYWGSGSGGVLALSTEAEPGTTNPRVRARVLGGGYGLAKADVAVRPDLGRHRLSAWGSALTEAGFRDHSAVQLVRGGLSGRVDLGGGRALSVVALGAWMPEAESPGGLSAEAAAADPSQTREASITQDARKAVAQGHLALGYAQPVGLPEGRVRVDLYGGLRDLDNPIVPRYIRLERQTAGARAVLEAEPLPGWDAGLGVEAELQRDDRLETPNEAGEAGAERLTDQAETVRSGALFARLGVPLTSKLTLTAAGRVDALQYEADDRLGGGGDASGSRTVSAVSPAIGLAYRWRIGAGPSPVAGVLYANAAGALDAPTTTELGNRPDGTGGFNPDLEPERTWGLELGTRGAATVGRAALGFDLALFAAFVDRLLLPFEIDDVTFYRNAGETRHAGVEAATDVGLPEVGGGRVEVAAAYAWTRARFAGEAGPEDAEIPGFPEHLFTWSASWQRTSGLPLVLALEGEAASAYFADDANTAATDAYAVAHARIALAGLRLGRGLDGSAFVELRNALDAEYSGSVVVNAFGGRYYEPAAGRHLLVGVAFDVR